MYRWFGKVDELVTASMDKLVKSWDVQASRCTRCFEGHTRGIRVVTHNDDLRCVARMEESNSNSLSIWCPLLIYGGHILGVVPGYSSVEALIMTWYYGVLS